MRARKIEITRLTAEAVGAPVAKIGLEGSPTAVWKIFTPKPRSGGEMLEGTPAEMADQLFQRLRERNIV